MINEEKVILMTKLAAYEQKEGKKHIPIINYFRTDYISLHLLQSFVYGTMAFMAILGVVFFYNFEAIMGGIYNIDLFAFAKKVLIIYLICMAIYLLATYVFALYKYGTARRSLKGYSINLKKLKEY